MTHLAVFPGLVTVTLFAAFGLGLVWLTRREPAKPRTTRSPRKVSQRTRARRVAAPPARRARKSKR